MKWLFLAILPFCLEGKVLDESFDLQTLKEAKVGYYIGSFDPIHLGHQNVIEQALQSGHVDYVLIYPAPGGDSFKNRTPLPLRQKMIAALYKDHPQVLFTYWTPKELQDRLSDLEVVGMIGSDVITETFMGPDKELSEKYRRSFMRGIPLQEKHYHDTAGAVVALKASSFIVSLRGDIDLSFLQGKIDDRPILAFTQSSNNSSTKVRNAVQNGEPFGQFLSPTVQEMIEQEGLYGFRKEN